RLWSLVSSHELILFSEVMQLVERSAVIVAIFPLLSGKGFDVGDQLDEIVLAELAREVGHHRRVAGAGECPRQQDTVSEVALIGPHRGTVLQMHDTAVNTGQSRGMPRAVLPMAAAAAVFAQQ